jgi:WD40 repeat protein
MIEAHTYDIFISYAAADREWVEGYLLDALEQAGVHYHYEHAFELGAPRLLEFERAIEQSQRILLVLSPAYLADGFFQFVDLLAQNYGLETATWPVIPLILHPVTLPPRLRLLTSLDATDQASWPEVIERLSKALQRPIPGLAAKPPCPYPGIVPFAEGDSERFFGRDKEVQEVLKRLRLSPFLAIIGPSGSGKSSLVFAGVLPALHRSGLFGSGDWLVRSLRPGRAPMAALATALGSDGAEPVNAAIQLLSTPTGARRLLLIVDQFEEVFTLADQDEIRFQEAVQHLAETPNCYVVLTIRADFYPDLMSAPLWQNIQAHRVEVLPLGPAELRQAIVLPAERVGVFIETALVERLLADAAREPGVLPLIQETLVLLWERVERRLLAFSAYEELVLSRSAYGGPSETRRTGLQVAIAMRADAALAELSANQQAIARRIFLRLIQFGNGRVDTRRQQTVSDLRAVEDDPAVFDQTLRHLTDSRLLTTSGEESGTAGKVDIAHEALIVGWPTLQGWLTERREAESTRRRLEDKAVEWTRLGQGDGGLLDEVEVVEAERWLASADAIDLGYSEVFPKLVEASRRAIEERRREKEAARQRELAQAQALVEAERQRAEDRSRTVKRLRRMAGLLAVVSLIAVAAAIYASNQARISLSRQLAAQSLSHLDDQLDLALLLSLEANHIADTLEARGSLVDALASSRHLTTFLRGHSGTVSSVAFSSDGKTIASGSHDHTVILWDVATRRPRGQPLKGHTNMVMGVAFGPDSKTLASASADHTVILWDVATGRPRGKPLVAHKGWVESVAFSPDGLSLATGGGDGEIILWDIERQIPTRRFNAHKAAVTSVAFSPDGNTLVSGSCAKFGGNKECAQGEIRWWDLVRRQALGEPSTRHEKYVTSVAFSPNGRWLASASQDQSVILWDVATRQPRGQPLKRHSNWVQSIAFSPDSLKLASGSADGSIILWDVESGQPRGQPLRGHVSAVQTVAFGPDGNSLVSGSTDDTVILWDLATPQPLGQPLSGHTDLVYSVAFSPDGGMLASGSQDRTIMLWDVAKRKPLGQLKGLAREVYSVAFSPDGKTLASGSGDRTIVLWDVATRQPLGPPLKGHTNVVNSVAFGPDGKTLASGSGDRTVILWDVATRRPRGAPLVGHTDWIESVAFSPDGKTIASGSHDQTIILWDVSDMAAPHAIDRPLVAHTDWVFSVAFSADGKLLASGGQDQTIVLWDVASRRPVGSGLKDHTNKVRGVAFSPNDNLLASASWDKTVMLWDVDIESWQARVCSIANRNLRPEEWQQYLPGRTYRKTCADVP